MKFKNAFIALAATVCAATTSVAFAVSAGQAAPDFTLVDAHGKPAHLADYKGKYVVLEWTNPECPFVRRHYNSKNMPELQGEWSKQGVVWLAIDSSSRSSGEYKTPAELDQFMRSHGAAPTQALVDGDSATARLYAAKTTPHMFVIDPQGRVVYAGAIDDQPSSWGGDARKANNYVRAALTSSMNGRPVDPANTTPYGCSIKY